VDNNHKTFHAFIEDYIFKWQPNNVKYGQDWRVDKPITVRLTNGTTAVKKPNTINNHCMNFLKFHLQKVWLMDYPLKIPSNRAKRYITVSQCHQIG
jgi:hypothetical protein